MTITNPRLLYFKAALFLISGLLASAAIISDRPTLRLALLLAAAIWSFARAYYFAFYAIEHYIDPRFRYSGLTSLLRHLRGRTR